MTLYLNNPIYLHNSVRSYFSNLTKALEHQNEHQNESDKKIYNYGSSLENHTFDSLKNLIKKSEELKFILGKDGDEGAGPAAVTEAEQPEPAPVAEGAGTAAEPAAESTEIGGGGRVKRTRNLRNRGNNKSQKQRKRKHLNYTKK